MDLLSDDVNNKNESLITELLVNDPDEVNATDKLNRYDAEIFDAKSRRSIFESKNAMKWG
jgi:hypothetical protein